MRANYFNNEKIKTPDLKIIQNNYYNSVNYLLNIGEFAVCVCAHACICVQVKDSENENN